MAMATLEEALAVAQRCRQAGRYAEAEGIYRQIVQALPHHAEAWAHLAQMLLNLQRTDEALAACGQALALAPDLVAAYRTLGLTLLRRRQVAEAERACREALRRAPDDPESLAALAVVHATQGRAEEAERLFDAALAAAPELAEAHANRATLLARLGRLEEATAAAERAVALKPFLVNAQFLLGTLHHQQGRLAEAAQTLVRTVQLKADHLEALSNLGFLLPRLGRLAEAVTCCRRALEVDPDHQPAHINLGVAVYRLYQTGEVAAARQAAGDWLARHPDHPVARHLAAAVLGNAPPERASDDFVRQLFDSFAPNFDATLGGLGYRAPELLAGRIGAERAADNALDVLDLGCGSGLCGPRLRPFARRLVGVDLSERLLEQARARGVYDELAAGEATAFLAARPGSFDLVVAADVFCYFGALEAVAAAAAAALRPGGTFAFTAERLAMDEESGEESGEAAPGDYRLLPHGRYSHAGDYLRRVVAGAGLSLRGLDAEAIRHENGAPVAGWVVLAGR